MNRYSALCIILLLFSISIQSQTPTIQDCLGAIPVCQPIYTEAISTEGAGNYENEVSETLNCTRGEDNSIWYTFTAQANGDLGFLITPNDLADDYDWSLFDITNAECSDILTNLDLAVSCNAAGSSQCNGVTGCNGTSAWTEQGFGCSISPPTTMEGFSPFNDFVPMQAGNTYVLMITNWTGSPNGYTIDFSSSTGIGIFDETKPYIEDISFPDECGENTIEIVFSENIQCSTIDVGNFILTGPGGPYFLALTAEVCDNGGNQERFFTLTINPPLQEIGTYQLSLNTDEITEVLDLCGNPALSQIYSYELLQPTATANVDIGADTSLLCSGDYLILDATSSLVTYEWQDGSTDSTLTINAAGIYSVTLSNTCGTSSDEIEIFVQNDVPDFELGNDDKLCSGVTLLLDASDDIAFYEWQDGSTSPTFLVNMAGTYFVVVTNGCGSTADEITIDYFLPLFVDLGDDVVLCKGETHLLDVTHTELATYLWEDGSSHPIRSITNTGLYAVTVTTICEEITDEIDITFIEIPLFDLGNDTFLCKNESLYYDFTVADATYLWQDGSTNATYHIDQTGMYAVIINTMCSEIKDTIFVIAVDSIRTDLGRDTFLCRYDNIVLDASSGVPADYEWQDGSIDSIYPIKKTGIYTVHISNICEDFYDEIEIKRCELCDVYVPNAFSPNDDGINDLLLPYSDCPLEDFSMQIFNRWGGLIFETNDPAQGWDGRYGSEKMGNGHYIWAMEFRVLENNRWQEVAISGGSLLIR